MKADNEIREVKGSSGFRSNSGERQYDEMRRKENVR
jgi:hypothetical protein